MYDEVNTANKNLRSFVIIGLAFISGNNFDSLKMFSTQRYETEIISMYERTLKKALMSGKDIRIPTCNVQFSLSFLLHVNVCFSNFLL